MTQRIGPVALILAVVGLVLPWVVYPVVAIDLACFALFAVSLDLLFGFVGLLSFGQALFWGGGGYLAAIMLARTHVDASIAIVVGIVYAIVLAAIVGAIAVRRAGIYFAMITLGVAQIQYFSAFQLTDITGGENGLNLHSRGTLFGFALENDRLYYYVALVLIALAVWFAVRLVRSPFGGVLSAMRENETRTVALGYRVNRYKLAVFTIAGGLAGLAGALYAIGNHLAGLEMVDWHTSGAVVMMTVLGGIGTIFGPIVGAGLFESLEYFVSKMRAFDLFGVHVPAIGEETNMVMGFIFALCVLLFRRGIVGEILARVGKRREPH
ncbi:MAG: leucine/isoleucine/valine transporter permease subunit [Candidatus Eremiobacteraeota bacterium]|nr:leucine/isoleucine/valine transporter permease subunit [Candidatus Eremiobacteraeota bacterium]